jgi:hypothetical protein
MSHFFAGGTALIHIFIKATAQAEGDIHLLDATNWNVSKAMITQIRVVTTSNDWDLWILQNDNGFVTNDANIPAHQLMNRGRQEETIEFDYNYEDEDATNEVHLYAVDNGGTATFDFYIKGVELQ